MSATFLPALETEIFELEQELERDERYLRLIKLREVQALYGKSDRGSVSSPIDRIVTHYPDRPPRTTYTRTPSPERRAAVTAARLYLLGKSEPVPTSEILDHVLSRGIPISGKEPRNNLSAMLSNSGLFVANGRSGWTIRRPVDADDDTDERADVMDDNADLEQMDAEMPEDDEGQRNVVTDGSELI